MAASKKISQRQGYKINEHIVYPAHGVGKIVAIEEKEVAGIKLELFVINFPHEKMMLSVPVAKAEQVGMRKLAAGEGLDKGLQVLKGRARVKRTMWSRRAQEYEAKINSGSLILVAEVVRDLYRSESQPEPSYSERQLYEQALERMAREIAAADGSTQDQAVRKIEIILSSRVAKKAKPDVAETLPMSTGEANSDLNIASQAA